MTIIDYVSQSKPIESNLIASFEEMGYEYSWDFNKTEMLQWHEFYDPITKNLAIQIEFGVTLNQFLKWFSGEQEDRDFMVAGENDSKEWKRLSKKIKEKFNVKWKL